MAYFTLQYPGSPFPNIHSHKSVAITLDQSLDVFPHNIKFQVDRITRLQLVKIGMLESIRNNGDGKSSRPGIKTGETGTVNGNRAFFYSYIATPGIKGKIKYPASISGLNILHFSHLVNVALNNMSVKTAVG